MFCIHCGAQLPDGSTFCPFCGAPQAQAGAQGNPGFASQAAPAPARQAVICPNCGTQLPGGTLFCLECGFELAQPAANPGRVQSYGTPAAPGYAPNGSYAPPAGSIAPAPKKSKKLPWILAALALVAGLAAGAYFLFFADKNGSGADTPSENALASSQNPFFPSEPSPASSEPSPVTSEHLPVTSEQPPEASENTQVPAENPFEDVKPGKYYYDAVLWAVSHNPQITKGTDATHFDPNSKCTRGQVVTFLWRAVGMPEPAGAESPFTDVKNAKKYYFKAVLWAVEQGITNGTAKDAFSPDRLCTRAQVVVFLWRAKGKPEPSGMDSPFTDVTDQEASYYKAVLWAVENKITSGTTKTTFEPGKTCTRGEVVTFLNRAFGDE